MKMITVYNVTALEDALENGYDLKFSATRGWLLVSAYGDTMRLAAKLVFSATFRDRYIPKRSLDDSEITK